MRKINHLSEFEDGKEYQRIAGSIDHMVEVYTINGRPWARHITEQWRISLGVGVNYYRTDILSSSEEL